MLRVSLIFAIQLVLKQYLQDLPGEKNCFSEKQEDEYTGSFKA
jgi:hypothetical protein